jgi:hypothetical protein
MPSYKSLKQGRRSCHDDYLRVDEQGNSIVKSDREANGPG